MSKYAVVDKDTIKKEIIPYLSIAKRGLTGKFDLLSIVTAILYKLRTGCQWEYLPVCNFFDGEIPGYKTIFYHYRKWCRPGDREMMFSRLVRKYRHLPDFSLSHIDGSHTPAVRGGEGVGYQGRKKRKTTSSIYFTDRQGLPLAISEPRKGNHADLYRIKDSVDCIAFQPDRCGIPLDGIFNNADAGFDALSFRKTLDKYGIIANVCPNPRNGELSEEYLFDEVMYKERFAIERTNAWMDSFRSILCRFDTTLSSWKGWNYLAFAVVFLKKIHKSKKFR